MGACEERRSVGGVRGPFKKGQWVFARAIRGGDREFTIGKIMRRRIAASYTGSHSEAGQEYCYDFYKRGFVVRGKLQEAEAEENPRAGWFLEAPLYGAVVVCASEKSAKARLLGELL